MINGWKIICYRQHTIHTNSHTLTGIHCKSILSWGACVIVVINNNNAYNKYYIHSILGDKWTARKQFAVAKSKYKPINRYSEMMYCREMIAKKVHGIRFCSTLYIHVFELIFVFHCIHFFIRSKANKWNILSFLWISFEYWMRSCHFHPFWLRSNKFERQNYYKFAFTSNGMWKCAIDTWKCR